MAEAVISALDTTVLNSEKFFQQMNRLMGASIGVIAVRTREINRAKELLHQWSSLVDLEFRVWTCLTGYQIYQQLPVTDDSENGEDKGIQAGDDMSAYLKPKEVDATTIQLDAALQLFADRQENSAATRDKICAVFVGWNQEYLTNVAVQQHLRDHTQRAYQCDDRIVILLEPGASIPDPLKTDIEVVDLLPPSFAELKEVLDEYDENISNELAYELDEHDKQFIIQNSIGMTSQEFENSVSLAVVDLTAKIANAKKANKKCPVHAVDFVNVIKQRKLEILKNTEILELMPDARMEDVGGLDVLKDFLERTSKTFSPEAKAFGIKPRKGALLVGPPGTAKSLIGRATGVALGVPTIRMAMDRLFGSLVGQTEQRARGAFKMIEEMAPCVLFIDEIDKVFKQDSGGDSGVSSRLLGMTLTWMQEKHDRGLPIFITASANDVSRFPPELVRKGRFDKIFAVTFPTEVERAMIFKIHVEMRGHKLTDAEYKALAKATNNYVGSEIEAGVEEALVDDFYKGSKKLQYDTVRAAMERMIPQSKAFPQRIKQMADWCEKNAEPASSSGSFEITGEDFTAKKPTIRPTSRPVRRLVRSKGD